MEGSQQDETVLVGAARLMKTLGTVCPGESLSNDNTVSPASTFHRTGPSCRVHVLPHEWRRSPAVQLSGMRKRLEEARRCDWSGGLASSPLAVKTPHRRPRPDADWPRMAPILFDPIRSAWRIPPYQMRSEIGEAVKPVLRRYIVLCLSRSSRGSLTASSREASSVHHNTAHAKVDCP